jgi:hypothetical protein
MEDKSPYTLPASRRALAEFADFSTHFTLEESLRLFHNMARAAFARKSLLDKQALLDILHLKEQLVRLITAAAMLSKDENTDTRLKELFQWKQAREWIDSLDQLFHAAAYDGFFVIPPADDDIYHTCRGLTKLIRICQRIAELEQAFQLLAIAPPETDE